MRFECDIEAFKDRRAMDEAEAAQQRAHQRAAIQVLRVHRLRQRAAVLFPNNAWNQEAWVQARLRLRLIGCTGPRVRIGCARHITGDLA